jgi:signal transduction histidine kinase
MAEVSSLDLDSVLTEDDAGARPAAGGVGEDDAAGNDGEARLRRNLRRATATNARLSAVVLVLATVYVGWLAERFAASRVLAAALMAVGLTAAVWRWSIGRAATVEVIPARGQELRFYSALDRNAYLVCLLWAPATLLVYPAITDKSHAVTYALCAVGSMSIGSMVLLPSAHRGYWALTATHIAAFVIASVFIESSRSWLTAFLLAVYGVAVVRISDQVRRTARRLLRIHRITDRLRHEALQREQALLVEAACAARSAELTATERQHLFMAKVGHEIRTPAQIIMADVEFLEHRLAGNPELHLTLRRLRSAANLVSHQMQGIADYARSQSWRSDDRLEQAALPVLINHIANLHATAANAKGLKVRVVAQDVQLRVDLGKVCQIVENLFGNAVKYTSTGNVTVSADVRETTHRARELIIVVADTGIGIPEEIQDRVFEPFFRAAQATSRKDGLGLGLAIVKALTLKLGGQVELQSRAGKGTTVIVAIPLVE